jgi:regulation of enolase protein 1 (concanavalin A-like superfamily)
MSVTTIDWDRVFDDRSGANSSGVWLNPPPAVSRDGDTVRVECAEGSDFWRRTAYDFTRDSGHAFLLPFTPDSAFEVSFVADFDQLYDQAGILLRIDAANWIKAGIEFTDGEPYAAIVATRDVSDWSLAPVPAWKDRVVTVRASWANGAVTIRARVEQEPWHTLRLAPLAADSIVTAGPMCCSPQRAGLEVTFTRFTSGPADTDLHSQP